MRNTGKGNKGKATYDETCIGTKYAMHDWQNTAFSVDWPRFSKVNKQKH